MMNQNYFQKNRGFTLLEVLLAVLIGGLVLMVMTNVFVSGMKHVRQSRGAERVAANASRLLGTIDYWVRQGSTLSVPDVTTLEVTQPGGMIKRFVKDGTRVMLDGQPVIDSDVALNDIRFEQFTNSVQVSFTLSTPNTQPFSAASTFALRGN